MEKIKTAFGSEVFFTPASNPTSKENYIGKIVSVTKEFKFSAGHFIPEHKAKCKYIHGHEYTLFVTVTGPIKENGMVIDFQDLSKIVDSIIYEFDHGFLNDFYELPTAEIMACHIKDEVNSKLLDYENTSCTKVQLYETSKCCATIEDTSWRCNCER